MSDAAFFSFSIPVGEVATAEPDGKWAQILPTGDIFTDDGRKVRITAEDLSKVFTRASARKSKLPILYEHGKGPRGGIAAGWMDSHRMEEGLFSLVKWNPRASEEIKNEEWKFISPGFLSRKDQDGFIRPLSLVEASLTNTPAFDGMRQVEASIITGEGEDESMGNTNETEVETTETVVEAAPPVVEASTAPPATQEVSLNEADIRAKVDSLVEAQVSARLAEIERQNKAKAIVEAAIADRKVSTAQREDALEIALNSTEAFERFCSKAIPFAASHRVVSNSTDTSTDNAAEALVRKAKEFQIQNKVSFRDAVVAVSK